MEKRQFQKHSSMSFLYHLQINQHKQIWLDLIGSFHQYFSDLINLFLKFGQFMLKIAMFSAKGDNSKISSYHLYVSACSTETLDN